MPNVLLSFMIVAIGAPSGVGKNTITSKLVKHFPDTYIRFPSIASRPMRPGETQGDPYFFITSKEFEGKIASGEVFEHTSLHGDYRGMSAAIIDEFLMSGKVLLKDVDYIGVLALREKYGPSAVLSIFLTVPREMAKERIQNREGTTHEYLEMRLANYDKEMETAVHFDHTVPNIDLDTCISQVHQIISMVDETTGAAD